jgi:hypothetical protein
MKSCEGFGSNSVARRSGASGATTRIKEANKAREVHANLKRPTTTCVVIVAKKATRPENGVRKNTTRRPKPTWSRGGRRTEPTPGPRGTMALHCTSQCMSASCWIITEWVHVTLLYPLWRASLVYTTGYKSIIGALQYLRHSQPYLAFAVGYLNRFMEAPREDHLTAIKCVLRYVVGTHDYGVYYTQCDENQPSLVSYNDTNMAGDIKTYKSTSGIIFFLNGNPIT